MLRKLEKDGQSLRVSWECGDGEVGSWSGCLDDRVGGLERSCRFGDDRDGWNSECEVRGAESQWCGEEWVG